MPPTTPAPRGGFRVIATSIRPVNHINLAAVAAGGGMARDERRRPEMPVQLWIDATVPGMPGTTVPDGASGFYANELHFPDRVDALAVLPLLVACNAPVRDGAKRLKVIEA